MTFWHRILGRMFFYFLRRHQAYISSNMHVRVWHRLVRQKLKEVRMWITDWGGDILKFMWTIFVKCKLLFWNSIASLGLTKGFCYRLNIFLFRLFQAWKPHIYSCVRTHCMSWHFRYKQQHNNQTTRPCPSTSEKKKRNVSVKWWKRRWNINWQHTCIYVRIRCFNKDSKSAKTKILYYRPLQFPAVTYKLVISWQVDVRC